MRKTQLILIMIVGLIGSSCCTKKDCGQDNSPQIVVKYAGVINNDLNSNMIYVLDKQTHEKIDSIDLSDPDNQFIIDKWLMYDIFGDKREFKQYDFVLKLPNRQDSVTDINYDRTSQEIDCNNCFPFGDGSATITDFKNLGFKVNNMVFATNDTIRIEL